MDQKRIYPFLQQRVIRCLRIIELTILKIIMFKFNGFCPNLIPMEFTLDNVNGNAANG